jgi:N-carbamoylputrescine amidase
MGTLTVALLQLDAGADQEDNLARGEAACREAAALGADVALFPELWQLGYLFDRPEEAGDLWRSPGAWAGVPDPRTPAVRAAVAAYHARALGTDSRFLARHRELAAELGMAIAVTYLQAWDPAPRNAVTLIDRHGRDVLTYAKVHTCDFDLPEATLTPGDGFPVATLDTAAGPVQAGAMICYDREYPESARVLMLAGAELVLVPNACPLDGWRVRQLETRAIENMVGTAMANYAGWGGSCAFSPMIYDEASGLLDPCLVAAGEGEGIHLARFDLDALRAYRARETLGNAFRRPHLYRAISDHGVREPFVRVDEAGAPWRPDGAPWS